MARYRKVDSRIWNDEKFSSLGDDGQLVFLFLLTHPHQTALGAMRASIPGLASEKGWPLERFAKAFGQAFGKGMVKHDSRASCVWLPNFLRYNGPESPNVVRHWGSAADLIPECTLKLQSIQAAKTFLKAYTEGFHKAFAEVFGEDLPKTMPNPDPDPDPEQEHSERETLAASDAPRGTEIAPLTETKGNIGRTSRGIGVIDFGTALITGNTDATLDEWKRSAPEVNAEAFALWVAHWERKKAPQRMEGASRMFQARDLATRGGNAFQAALVAYCMAQGWSTIIPNVDYVKRTQGSAGAGAGTRDDRERKEADRLEQLKGSRAERGIPDFRLPFQHETADAYETAMRTERNQRGYASDSKRGAG